MKNVHENNSVFQSSILGVGGKRFIIAGGGTGGHIFPAIAIANAIKQLQPDASILFIGAEGKMEMEKVPQAGYPIKGLSIVGFNRSSLIKNASLPFKIMKSFFQVRNIFKYFKPNAVIGVGGYSSFPVLRFAQSRGISTFIHESNSFAGKANMMLGKKAIKIFVATDGMEQFFPANKIVITGNPVRASIAHSKVTQAEALVFFGLQIGIKTVLVVGGSLGAKSINDAIANHIEIFSEQGLQLIWQTGKTNAAHYKALSVGKSNIWVNEFITQMEMGYAAADIIISRAGAMAITELCVVGKPSIFVPYPFASEDHQTANAMALVNKKAALLVKDSDVNEALINAVLELSKNELSQHVLQQNISALAKKNADEIIAKQILYP